MKNVYKQKEEEINFNREIALNEKEVYLLRLFLHGYQTFEITDFLEIHIDQYFHMINSIKSKLRCITWYQVIIKSFKNGSLKQEDFIDDIVKNEAVFYSELLIEPSSKPEIELDYISKLVIEFITKCDNKLRFNNKENFSSSELDYLDLKFKGFEEDIIKKRLDRSLKEIETLEENIFYKLNTNNWFNALKKAFHLEIVPKHNILDLHIDVEATNTASNIVSLFSFKNMSIKEKQLAVYHELLRYYATIEFKFLEQADL